MNRDALIAAGMDVDDALSRVLGNEMLFDRLLGLYAADGSYAGLKDALERGDLEAAEASAHALKGVSANLSLVPVRDLAMKILSDTRAGDLDGARSLMPALDEAQQAALRAIG